MATTSIWRVKGWLGKVVVYVENPDKTTNPKSFTDKDMAEQDGQELSDVIRYAVNSRKTQKADNEDCAVVHRFVSGINCSPSTARDEMLAVKKRFGKESGTVAYHGYQSFAPGEATPEMAHEIGIKLAARLWGDRYQVIVATHLDKENHLHNHFVLNTVSFVDGIKYHRTKKDYHDMQTVSDELCREYRLSVIENPQYGKAKQYGEWRAEQEQRPTWRWLIRADMDEAIRQSMTERQFFDNLRKKGYEVKIGKDISVRPPGKERFVRLIRNFGEDYALIYKRPAPVQSVDELPNGMDAVYDREQNAVFVRRGLSANDLFCGLSKALAQAELARTGEEYTEENAGFKAQCVSYILGKEFGVDVTGYAFEAPADFLRTDDPQTIRTELTDIRDTAYDISSRMMRSLEQSKAPRQSEQER